jgi:hypothetical protein
MPNNTDKNLEAAMYRMAKRKGFQLQKCRSRHAEAPDCGIYRLVNPHLNAVALNGPGNYGLTLDEVAEYLRKAEPLGWTALIQR